MNDLISRSELIADLEHLKVSMGDVVLGLVVDRVIERVRETPSKPRSAIEVHQDQGMEKMDFHGITWLPDMGYSRELANTITLLYREGYVPDVWSFDPATETDLRCVSFRMVKGKEFTP